MEEGVVQAVVAFVAHEQAAVAVQPGEVTLHDPAVASQALTRVDPFAGNAWGDPAAAEHGPVAAGGVAQVGVQFAGPSAWAQIDRVLTINSLATVTTDVVDAARESLVVSAL